MADKSTPAPAEQAPQQAGTTALADDQVAPTHFIPQATQDNYAQIARDQGQLRDVEPKQVMQELADQWEQLHERQPLDGYDHLAAWARDFDPAIGGAPSGLAILQARMLESARRDPQQAVIGDQALVEQAVASQRAADEGKVGSTSSPTIGPDSGLLPNPGPLPVPEDVAPSTASQQEQQQDTPPPPAAEPTPADTSSKSSKSSDTSSS
jgi:hypothetical protein